MPINIRRGLLRLWLVATFCWIIVVTFGADPISIYRDASSQLTTAIKPETGFKVVFDPKSNKWIPAEPLEPGSDQMKAFREVFPQYNDLSDENLSERLLKRALEARRDNALIRERGKDRLQDYLLFALIPPVIALALGGAMAWIVKGFKAR